MATTRPQFQITLDGRRVRLGVRTLIAGVLNATPDSFSDGGRFIDPGAAVRHAMEMVRAGADWIDVGGESTRPGARPVSAEEELRRVLPIIRGIHKRFSTLPISIDTTKGVVAEQAIQAGASLVNDVSGLRFDASIAEVARRHRVPLVLMHLRGRPATMQQKAFARSASRSVGRGIAWSIQKALALGVRRSQLMIDPGLGFGKTRRQNFELIARLAILRRFHLPIMVGASRKSFIQAVVAGEGLDPTRQANPGGFAKPVYREVTRGKPRWRMESRAALDFGDAAALTAAILAGAHIVRMHNVAAALPAARIADAILAAAEG
ncbi:MAG: dihydropteroate synthase [Terriglobia bacterium]